MISLGVKIAIALALLGSSWYAHERQVHSVITRIEGAKDDEWGLRLATLQGLHDKALADEVQKTHGVELKLSAALSAQELKDESHRKIVARYTGRISDLLAAGSGRLRDPNMPAASAPCSVPAPSDPALARSGADNTAEAGGLLSKELSGLLSARLQEADELNLAYASCRSDSITLRAALALPAGAGNAASKGP